MTSVIVQDGDGIVTVGSSGKTITVGDGTSTIVTGGGGGGGGGSGGAPSGPAGGVLGGTYPNPSFASDMATQAELDAGLAGKADTTDARLSDARVPTDGSVTAAKVNTALKPSGSAAAGTEALRALGSGSTQAAAGNDSRFPSTGQKNALAGTSGTPGTGNEYVTTSDARNSNARTPTAHTHPESEITGLVTDLAAKVPKTLVDAKGDLLTATADDTPARLAVGTDGQVLFADSAQTTGLRWGAGTGAGVELGYAQITSDVSQAGFGNVDVPGLSVTVTVGTRPIKVIFDARNLYNTASNGVGSVAIKEGATQLASASLSNVSVANILLPGCHREVRLAPSAGTHTYKINLSSIVGTTTIAADATSPAFIQVVEV